ncbi:type II secretion system protein GspM [Blastomonas sp.]|uniref:type II secretion system protein GspM n=1 Tax=Blastomonas sp. TaxID=1909299 RepID=UPI003593BBA8
MKNWLLALSRREQVLVGIAAVLALAVLGYFAVYRPLYMLATDAKRSFYEATMLAGRIEAKTRALSLPAQRRPAEAIAALNLLLASEAGERGFTLDRNDPSGNARADIAIASARSTAFLGWLADLERRGVVPETLTIRRMDNGMVSVSARLAKLGS